MSKFRKMWLITWAKENGRKGYARVSGNTYEDVLADFLAGADEYEFTGQAEDVTIEYDGYEGACGGVA